MTSPRTDQHSGSRQEYPGLSEHRSQVGLPPSLPPSHHLVDDHMSTHLHQLTELQGNVLLCLYLVPETQGDVTQLVFQPLSSIYLARNLG